MAGKGTVKIGHIRSLHKHLGEILDGFDSRVAQATDNPPHTPGTPEPPAAADAAPERSMSEAFPEMRRDSGLTVDALNRLNRRR